MANEQYDILAERAQNVAKHLRETEILEDLDGDALTGCILIAYMKMYPGQRIKTFFDFACMVENRLEEQ
jgi:hypothetical protein